MKVDVDRESQMVWLATNLVHDTYVVSQCASNIRCLVLQLIVNTVI